MGVDKDGDIQVVEAEIDDSVSQTEALLRALRRGEHVNRATALLDYGIFNLPARVFDLRQMGLPVMDRYTTIMTRRGPVTLKEYWMPTLSEWKEAKREES